MHSAATLSPEETVHLTRLPRLQGSLNIDIPIAPSGQLHLPRVSPRELPKRPLHGQALAVEVDGHPLGHCNWRLPDTRLLCFDSEDALGRLLHLAGGIGCIVDE